ncbi:DUF4374 domain-containing protein [Parapedobacter lycopersici]|uniref:DUF4374 domain-containing protein n=1 Tax=Parapedobacter lycopersici TaxID=1864939 RepID=UPI00214D726C|nr:DUF4374 domain-containing protein [Parapedobacter lycopersici]
MKISTHYYAWTALSLAISLGACSKNDSIDNNTGKTKGSYIVAVTPVATTGVADYLINAPSLDNGTISTAGNGLEQDGTYRYYVTHNNKFFSMLYGQGNPGAVTAYDLRDGSLNKLTNFQTETVQAFAPADQDVLLIKNSRNLASPVSHWYQVNTDQLLITGEGQFDSEKLAGNGELAHISWIKQVGNKVFAPYFCIKATDEGGWDTDYPDSAWIAVFDYPEMTLNKVIRDNRTSNIGYYFEGGMALDEQGDLYAFSASNTIKKQQFNSSKPSAIVRINAGTTAFDQNYYFNIEQASGGYSITGWVYVGNGNAIALMQAAADKSQWGGGNRLASINLVNKTFEWVTGAPQPAEITSVTTNNYTPLDGKTAYIGITTADSKSVVYNVNAATATATPGLQVEGGVITAVSKL